MLMIFVFLTAIVLLIILGLTVGMTFGQETGDSMTRSQLGRLLEIQQEQLMIIFISHIGWCLKILNEKLKPFRGTLGAAHLDRDSYDGYLLSD